MPAVGCGPGSFLEDAQALRAASSIPDALLCVRRASEVAALNVSGVRADSLAGTVDVEVRRQKDDQFGAAQLSRQYLSSAPAVGVAVVERVARCLPPPRAPFAWGGSKRPAFCRVGPRAYRPLYGRVGYVRFVEEGDGESKLVPSER